MHHIGMKQRLSAMAASFSNRNRDSINVRTEGRGENGTYEENVSMLSSNPMQRRETSDDDDDGEEVISFLESPAAMTTTRHSNSSRMTTSPMLNSKKDK